MSGGCPTFDRGPFSDYYQRVTTAIRAADPKHLIWYEPLGLFNQGAPTFLKSPSDGPRPNVGFAFHDYCVGVTGLGRNSPSSTSETCRSSTAQVLTNAQTHAAEAGDALLETEFGGRVDLANVSRLVAQNDAAMMPWLWWSYDGIILQRDGTGKLLPAVEANVDRGLVDVLVRPYPQLVAGTPLSWRFEPNAKTFDAEWSTQRADRAGTFAPGSVTSLSVPPRVYTKGYRVTVTGGFVTSAPGAGVLQVASCPGAAKVSVSVAPPGTDGGASAGSCRANANSAVTAATGRRASARGTGGGSLPATGTALPLLAGLAVLAGGLGLRRTPRL